MTTDRILQGDTEPLIAVILDATGNVISGATVTTRCLRVSDSFIFDWSDDTFKAFGSVATPDTAITEFTNMPGSYRLTKTGHVEGFNTASVTNQTGDETLLFTFDATAPAGALTSRPIEIHVDGYVKDIRDAAIAAVYLGRVTVNVNKGTDGTDPEVNGTPGLPVKTLADALTISDVRGTRELLLVTGLFLLTDTLDEFFVVMRDESELRFEGQNVNGSEFHGGFIKGAMSGRVEIRGSTVEDISDFDGKLEDCELLGVITMAVDASVTIHQSDSGIPGTGRPELAFRDGATAGVRNWDGGILISDMTDAANKLTLECNAAAPVIAASCTEGVIELRGVGEPPIDNSGPNCIVDTSGYRSRTALTPQETRDAMKLAPTAGAPAAGSVDDHLDDIFQYVAVGILKTLTVSGGDAITVNTSATEADGYYDRMLALVETVGGEKCARRIKSYALASGAFELESALPFTPASGDTFTVIGIARDDPPVVGSGIGP